MVTHLLSNGDMIIIRVSLMDILHEPSILALGLVCVLAKFEKLSKLQLM